jgi:hypothetical protein
VTRESLTGTACGGKDREVGVGWGRVCFSATSLAFWMRGKSIQPVLEFQTRHLPEIHRVTGE